MIVPSGPGPCGEVTCRSEVCVRDRMGVSCESAVDADDHMDFESILVDWRRVSVLSRPVLYIRRRLMAVCSQREKHDIPTAFHLSSRHNVYGS